MDSVVEGQTISVTNSFLDDNNYPVEPDSDSLGVTVVVLDEDKALVFDTVASIDKNEPGSWVADIVIPNMGLVKTELMQVVWKLVESSGSTWRNTVTIEVHPAGIESELDHSLVALETEPVITFALPFELKPSVAGKPANVAKGKPAVRAIENDLVTFNINLNNKNLMEDLSIYDPAIKYEVQHGRTLVSMPNILGGPSRFQPANLTVSHLRKGQFSPTRYTYTIWNITPQILVACTELEAYVNKAKLENIIPSLDYTQSDLLTHLYNGLQYLNMLPPQLTGYNGCNMQGILFGAWMLCSIRHLLNAQIGAEGALAFDFAGQDVSLNVDRTQALESMLGRVEAMVQEQVPQTKKLLVRAGVLSGDGSQGANALDGRRSLGALSLTNAPTTKLNSSRNIRTMYWNTML